MNQPLLWPTTLIPNHIKKARSRRGLKAIGYFEQVLQLSRGTLVGEYALQMLPTLRQQHFTVDGYRFFCVYD